MAQVDDRSDFAAPQVGEGDVGEFPVERIRAQECAVQRRPDAEEATADVRKYAGWGAGPRASQYLVLGAKARAAMDGRTVPDVDDVRSVALPVLRHRVVLNFQAEADGVAVEQLIPLARR